MDFQKIKNVKRISISILILLTITSVSFSQSLLKDVNTLLINLDTLKTYNGDYSQVNSKNSAVEVLSILHSYSNTLQLDPNTDFSIEVIRSNVKNNDLLSQIISDSILLFPDSIILGLTPKVLEKIETRQNDNVKRNKIIQLLHAERAVTPSEYLSLKKTISEYKVPPVSHSETLNLALSESKPKMNNGLMTSQAEFIIGLFQFVLDRAQDEVIINFLDNLITEDTPNFKTLFPTVTEEFANQNITYSGSFITRLKRAFQEDLELMGSNLITLMMDDKYFSNLQEDPVVFNVLALYSMMNMARDGIGIEEIIPVTHRYIYQNYSERDKEVNFLLAEKAYTSLDYQNVINESKIVVDRIQAIFIALDDKSTHIDSLVGVIEKLYCSIGTSNCLETPIADDYIGNYNIDMILGNAEAEDEFRLTKLPRLLRGQLESRDVAGTNTIEGYDKFFSIERSPHQWRAAGLDIVKKLEGTWYDDLSIVSIYKNWEKDIRIYHQVTQDWIYQVMPDSIKFTQEESRLNQSIQKLSTAIRNAKNAFWVDVLTNDQELAFEVLLNLVYPDVFLDIEADVREEFFGQNLSPLQLRFKYLKAKEKYLEQVEKRYAELEERLYRQNPEHNRISPLYKYVQNKQAFDPYAKITFQIEQLEKDLLRLKKSYHQLESREKATKKVVKIRENAKPILQITEMLTYLMYGLYDPDESNNWLSRKNLQEMLNGRRNQQVFLGLLQQSLGQIKGINTISNTGLTQLVELTIRDLPQFISEETPDSLKFYYKIAFVVNTMNRILEIPLIVDPIDNSKVVAFVDFTKNKKLARLPEVSRQVLDITYYLQTKDHKHAISTFLRLFSELNISEKESYSKAYLSRLPEEEKEKIKERIEKRNKTLKYMQKYGHFIADLIDAESSEEVKDLLENIADPPGSSRAKRSSPITVGLNAYVGGTFGYETWESNLNNIDDDFYNFSANIPIGITVSGLAGKKDDKKRASFSLFISFLDLGGLLNLRADSDATGQSEISFKNVFRPGWQVHYNIRKSPFYIGIGGQYGLQYRVINGDDIGLRSRRHFINFGIDVPIKSFYQK